ncbi:MAG TPA: TVP38/TMEM64 family protein [Bacillales bacterium]|nr:TVP38/TMEM64 family protein [Bacillales bacterium]
MAIESYFTIDHIRHILQDYKSFGPLLGILLPLLEAFVPILPLMLFVAANAAVYGFLLGSLISWAGTCFGAVLVFFIFRSLARGRLKYWLHRRKKIRRTLRWVEEHGFGPLFLVLCIPFTPSSLVNVAAGLSDISFKSFLMSVLLGKMVLIFMVSSVGYDWMNILDQPFKLSAIAGVVVVLWLAGKRMEKRMLKKKQTNV